MKKRDGRVLSEEDINSFVHGAAHGTWADYQLSAMLMALFLQGMNLSETALYTRAMANSGRRLDLSKVAVPKVDKHSSGGVGDKVSIHLAAMVACCGLAVPMISGRGLGHTGGTLDKLEAFPGFRTQLSMREVEAQMQEVGAAIIGASPDVAPSDRKLYALRDVTGTVESQCLICASILSKKLAEGIDALVLDIKFGKGAFMKDVAHAEALARQLVDVGTACGMRTAALITSMDEPLGHNVGNALELQESLACLRGEGPADIMAVTFALGSRMLVMGGVAKSEEEATAALQATLSSGAALARFRAMVAAQGGDVACVDDPSRLPKASIVQTLPCTKEGFIVSVDAMGVAEAVQILGGGRRVVEDVVDPAVGVTHLVKVGQRVAVGAPLCLVHGNGAGPVAEAAAMLQTAIVVGDAAPEVKPLVHAVVV